MEVRHNPGPMKSTFTALPSSALVLAVSAAVYGQSTPPPAPTPPPPAPSAVSAGLINDWLRAQDAAAKAWDLGGQGRARYEYREHFAIPGGGPTAVDFRANAPQSENDFLLLRAKFHVGYTPCEWTSVYAEGRTSSSTADRRNPNPQSDGPVDLHQGFVQFGNAKAFPLTAKIGRQELSYGDERLIGAFDWDNIGRVFDAAKVRFQNEQIWVDGFVGRVVIPDDNNWNNPNWHDWFWGVYASTRAFLPQVETQFYLLGDNVDHDSLGVSGTGVKGNTPRDIYTAGTRFKSLPGKFKGWDFDGELAWQAGDFEYAPGTPGVRNGKRLDHFAFAAHVGGGYTFATTAAQPRIGLEYNFASGDNNPTDAQHNTFVNLFPTNHKFYGYMDFFSLQNVHNPRLSLSVNPAKSLSVRLDYHAFWLATTGDFFYQVNQQPRTTGGYGINQNAGSFVGQEVDLVATYSYKTIGALEAGYGHFFTGSYVDATFNGKGGAADANWVYVQARLNF